jgi:predicted TIM-barrel fold metal-dependent hydrolase
VPLAVTEQWLPLSAYCKYIVCVLSTRVVDSHLHLWDLQRLRYSWLTDEVVSTHVIGDYTPICRNYLLHEYLADTRACGVVKAVHVQAATGHPNPVDETAWLQEVSDTAGFRIGIVGYVDLRDAACERVLDAHMRYANFRGVRMLYQPGLFGDAAFRRGMRALAERDLVYGIDADAPRMTGAISLAADFPEIQFVLDHVGFPKSTTSDYFREWQRGIATLASAPNVACKISGLSMIYHEPSAAHFRPWVRHAWSCFGVERCLFGSYWPVDSLFSDFPTLLRCYSAALPPTTAADRDALFAGNAERIFRI